MSRIFRTVTNLLPKFGDASVLGRLKRRQCNQKTPTPLESTLNALQCTSIAEMFLRSHSDYFLDMDALLHMQTLKKFSHTSCPSRRAVDVYIHDSTDSIWVLAAIPFLIIFCYWTHLHNFYSGLLLTTMALNEQCVQFIMGVVKILAGCGNIKRMSFYCQLSLSLWRPGAFSVAIWPLSRVWLPQKKISP